MLGLTTENELIRFDSDNPGATSAPVAVTGLQAGETLLGVDYRPATGQLFGLGSSNRVYTVNPLTGAAAAVGSGPFTPALAGTAFGFDFNPTVDRIRVDSNSTQNLRLNPNDGTAIVDGTLAYAVGDSGAGITPQVAAVAYTNSFAGATSTTLYVVDTGRDVLAIQNPANAGTLTTVGAVGLDLGTPIGFEIDGNPGAGQNTAYLAAAIPGGTGLYQVNLATGQATPTGAIGGGHAIRDIAAMPAQTIFYGVSAGGALVAFDASAPNTPLASTPISGLQAGETLLGVDVRPATGQLYGLGSTSRIYTINPTTGVATAVSATPFTPALSGTAFGFDFNPTVDRIRVVSNTTQNLRINPIDGTAIVDGSLAYAVGDPGAGTVPQVSAAAYTNSVAGATTTSLYVIDLARDVLATQNPANAGTLNTVGALGFDVIASSGFDILPGTNLAYATVTRAGATTPELVTINLATGAATTSGAALPLVGLATGIPLPAPSLTSIVRYGFHFGRTTIVLNFDQALNPASATDLANYQITTIARNGRPGHPIRLQAAVYDPTENSVTLVPVAPRLPLFQRYGLAVRGGVAGVTNTAFIPVSPTVLTATFDRSNLGGQTRPVPLTPFAARARARR
jgi:hypothetical protein